MSASGYKRLFSGAPSDFRCRPENRPSCPNVRFPPNCVSFRSESGPGAEGPFSSAFDPKRTFVGLYSSATTYNRRAMKTTPIIALLLGLAVVSVLVAWRGLETVAALLANAGWPLLLLCLFAPLDKCRFKAGARLARYRTYSVIWEDFARPSRSLVVQNHSVAAWGGQAPRMPSWHPCFVSKGACVGGFYGTRLPG